MPIATKKTIPFIRAVCISEVEGVPKYPQPSVTVATFGLNGDFHCAPVRKSFSNPGTFKPNTDRHITICDEGVYNSVNQELDLQLKPGDFGENILTSGIDLSKVVPNSLVVIGRVRLRVVEQNKPCKNLVPYHPFLNKTIYSPERPRRGLLCTVKDGIRETIQPGDSVQIYPPRTYLLY